MRSILTAGLSVLVVAILVQSAPAIDFNEDFDGSNGAWTVDGNPANSDIIPGKNGWVAHPTLGGIGHRVVNDVGSQGRRSGIGVSNGAGNSQEGCAGANPCGSAHPVSGVNIMSVLTRVNGGQGAGPVDGEGEIFFGNAAGTDGYQVYFGTAGAGSLDTLVGGAKTSTALASTGFQTAGVEWFELQIVVPVDGSPAFAQYRNVNDTNGAPLEGFTSLGTFGTAASAFDLIAIASLSSNIGGQALIHYDNVSASGVAVPEPAGLMLIGIGGLAMLRRRR